MIFTVQPKLTYDAMRELRRDKKALKMKEDDPNNKNKQIDPNEHLA
jgi:hypothetical protein